MSLCTNLHKILQHGEKRKALFEIKVVESFLKGLPLVWHYCQTEVFLLGLLAMKLHSLSVSARLRTDVKD